MIGVTARRLDQPQLPPGAQMVVDLLGSCMDLTNGPDMEDAVTVGGGNQQRPRRDQRTHVGQLPALHVDREHAVAVAVNGALGDVRGKRGSATDRRRHPHALIGRRHPPASGAPARQARHAELGAVHLRQCLKQVERPHTVP